MCVCVCESHRQWIYTKYVFSFFFFLSDLGVFQRLQLLNNTCYIHKNRCDEHTENFRVFLSKSHSFFVQKRLRIYLTKMWIKIVQKYKINELDWIESNRIHVCYAHKMPVVVMMAMMTMMVYFIWIFAEPTSTNKQTSAHTHTQPATKTRANDGHINDKTK